MRCKAMQLALWTLGTLLTTVSCLAIETKTAATPATTVLPHVMNSWPWLALGAIALLLAVIALAARRRLPFGPR
jgi:hypothetical protein